MKSGLTLSLAIFALTISLSAQTTYIPEDNFEQVLIDLEIDSGVTIN